MTPFDFPLLCDTDLLTDYGRRTQMNELDSALNSNPIINVFIYSPCGTGKTILLTRFFSEEKKKELLEKGILVQFCYFTGSQMRSDSDVYTCLIDAVTNGLQQIYDRTELYKVISEEFHRAKEEFKNYRLDEKEGGNCLRKMLNILKQKGFQMLLVLDNFQQLTCSECCSVHAFNYMSSLAQEHVLNFVVATDFHSKVASKAYGLSDFERIFDIRPTLKGISSIKDKRSIQKKIRELLRSFQEDEGTEEADMIEITDQELDWLFEVTAGIPGLLKEGLKAYYTERQLGWVCESKEIFTRVVYNGCKPTMMYWTKHFNSDYWSALNDIYHNRSLDSDADFSTEENKWKGLIDSCLVTYASSFGEYRFICPLFERYVGKVLPTHMKDVAPLPSADEEHEVFLSYKHSTDAKKVEEVEEFLRNNRIVPFYDKYLSKKKDQDYHPALLEAVGKSRNFIVFISDEHLITASNLELAGDWVHLEMCTFKKELDEGRKPNGRMILLLTDEIFDRIMKNNKQDVNILWKQNTEFIAWRDYKSKIMNFLK